VGINGNTVFQLPKEQVIRILDRHEIIEQSRERP